MDQAEEDGGTLPNPADLKLVVDKIASDACDLIGQVKIDWPSPTTVKPGDTETEQGDQSERDNESKHNETKHTESKDTESHTVVSHESGY